MVEINYFESYIDFFNEKMNMNQVDILYDKLKNKEPFCFIKLNDGEIRALNPNNVIISRGDERSSSYLSSKIKESLNYRNDNYYIGLPCIKCNYDLFVDAIKNININNTDNSHNIFSNILNANIMINSNLEYTINILSNTLYKYSRIIIVSNKSNLNNIDELSKINIYPTKLIKVSETFSFENDYDSLKDTWKELNDNDLVICLCGPLGRVLCYEWFKNNNNLTCLELGSIFDPLLRNKSYLYHTGTYQYCECCNPDKNANDSILLKIKTDELNETNKLHKSNQLVESKCIMNKECYYFHNETDPFNFYNNHLSKINKNNNIRLEKEPHNEILLKINDLCQSKINNKDLDLYSYDDKLELNYFKPQKNDLPFYIIYHIATINEKWKALTKSSYNKLAKSGILFDKNLKGIKISYLGNEENMNILKNIWYHKKVEIINNGTNFKLYEFPAIQLIKDICKNENCNILYFHCKGLLHKNDHINDWIDYLEYFNIEKYEYCLEKLIKYDVVGCNYYPSDNNAFYKKNPYPFLLYKEHFSGNFWWTKSSYINKLETLFPDENNRHAAEFWICSKEGDFWSYYTSSVNFGELNRERFNRHIYENLELLDLNFVRKNDYKQYSKRELFNIAENAYVCRHLKKLNKVCNLYLSYFIDINDEETYKMMFWLGFSNFINNPKIARKQFKILYNKNNIDDSTKFYTKCNLDLLYSKNNNQIPKIIHLIYFKGIEFMKFHYECVKSMIKHMPDYQIIIYNDIEPLDNNYWNEIKNNEFVTVKTINPPLTYDGYPLKYIQYKADVVRLEVLYEYGGIYLDLDMLVIKNFENIINTGKDFYICEENERGGGLINSFLACKPKNKFIKKWLESFKSGLRMDNWAYHIRESNKLLLDKNKHYFIKYNIEILESKHFFPFKWSEREKFENIKDHLNDDIYGIHLYETILKDILENNSYFNS